MPGGSRGPGSGHLAGHCGTSPYSYEHFLIFSTHGGLWLHKKTDYVVLLYKTVVAVSGGSCGFLLCWGSGCVSCSSQKNLGDLGPAFTRIQPLCFPGVTFLSPADGFLVGKAPISGLHRGTAYCVSRKSPSGHQIAFQ